MPEAPQRPGHRQGELDLTRIGRPVQRGPKVVVLHLQSVEPLGLVGSQQFRLRPSRKVGEELAVAARDRYRVGTLRQALARVLADRLEHSEPRLAAGRVLASNQALVDERRDPVGNVQADVEAGIADGLRGLEGPAPAEHRQSPEENPFGLVEQVEAPVDRPAQGLLARGQIAGTPDEERQALLEADEDRVGREQLHPRGRQLDGKRQAVESGADRGHRRVRSRRSRRSPAAPRLHAG